jgi:hypothetical protein
VLKTMLRGSWRALPAQIAVEMHWGINNNLDGAAGGCANDFTFQALMIFSFDSETYEVVAKHWGINNNLGGAAGVCVGMEDLRFEPR